MKNGKTRFFPGRIRVSARAGTALRMTGVVVLVLFAVLAQAAEIRLQIGSSDFATGNLPNDQTFEAFRFNLPQIPAGSRIDAAGLVLYIERDTVAGDYLLLNLLPITSEWSKAAVQSGQIPTVDPQGASFAVANIQTGDRITLRITDLVKEWIAGRKTNRGFMLASELPEEKTRFSVSSRGGIKAELFIYYTGPEVVKE